MCYNVKKMCRKSSPTGEGTGEGPLVAVGWFSCCSGLVQLLLDLVLSVSVSGVVCGVLPYLLFLT